MEQPRGEVVTGWIKVVIVGPYGQKWADLGALWELNLVVIVLGDGLDVQGPRAVLVDFRCLACVTGWMAVPFTKIRNLEKDQVSEGRLRVWLLWVVNKFVTVIDEKVLDSFLS